MAEQNVYIPPTTITPDRLEAYGRLRQSGMSPEDIGKQVPNINITQYEAAYEPPEQPPVTPPPTKGREGTPEEWDKIARQALKQMGIEEDRELTQDELNEHSRLMAILAEEAGLRF